MDTFTFPKNAGHAALRRGRQGIAGHLYLVTAATLARRPVFADFEPAYAAVRSFETPALLGDASLLAWVLMPDHAHWLMQLGDKDSLAIVVSRLKSASARNVNRATLGSGKLWARAFHDRALRHDEDVHAVARYVICNPLRAGLVKRVGDYPFWNAIWL